MKNMNPPNKMTSNRPYLIRAIYEWIADNNMTVYVIADISAKNIKIPLQYARDGKITLDISTTAALKLEIDNHYVRFSARFSGVLTPIIIPIGAIVAIFAKETGEGMMFELEDTVSTDENSGTTTSHIPHLKIIK